MAQHLELASPPSIHTETFEAASIRLNEEFFVGVNSATPPEAFRRVIQGNLCSAWAQLEQRLNIDLETVLPRCDRSEVFVQWIVQESHQGQRRPAVVGSGNHWFIYKPRSLECDIAWSRLLNEYEKALGASLSAKIKIISRPDYGWCEVVNHSECADELAIRRYYWRLGAVAALLWAIGGRDATASNMVAAGEFPTLIDAEMVLTADSSLFLGNINKEFRRVGIGPIVGPTLDGKIVSLGAACRREVSCRHRDYAGSHRVRCKYCCHVPFAGETAHFIEGHEEQVVNGFAAGLGCLEKVMTTASDLLWELFSNSVGRVAVRSTAAYTAVRHWAMARLFITGSVPDIDQLLRTLPTQVPLSGLQKVRFVAEERQILSEGDIPRFELPLSEKTLRYGNGKVLYRYRFSGLERAVKRLHQLGSKKSSQVADAWKNYVNSES